MYPVEYQIKNSEYKILFVCSKCKKKHWNKRADDDEITKLPELIKEDARLLEDLRLDSLSVLMFSMGIEEYYNIQLKEFVPFKTVKDVIEYLKGLGIEDK